MDVGQALKPTITELLVHSALAFLLILFSQYQNILTALTGEQVSDSDLRLLLSQAFETRLDSFLQLLEANELTAFVALALFWAGIGTVIYIIVSWLQKFFVEATDDLMSETRFVHPSSYRHGYFWARFVARAVFRGAVIIAIGVYSLVLVQMLIPLWLQLVEGWLLEPWVLVKVANAFLAFIGLMVSMHLMVVLFRFMLLRERIFDSA